MTRNLILTAFLFALGIAFSMFIYYGATKMQNAMARIEPAAGDESATAAKAEKSALTIGGSFEMRDENDHVVTDKNFADTYKLIFFGFTHCPDVCPAGMQKMTKTLEKLGNDAKMITPLFVSVDPRRDLPEVLREYTDMFDARIIGLRGNEKQTQDMEDKFKVYAEKIATKEGEDFEMYAHSAYIYLTDRNNHMVSVYGNNKTPEDMAKEIAAILKRANNTQ